MALSTKQRAFIEHYLACWNASEAARRAGYKDPGQAGYENKKKQEIQAAIDARIEDIITKGEIIERLAARARASIADVLALPSTDPPAESEKGLAKLAQGSWSLDLVKAQRTGAINQVKKLKSGKYGDEVEVYDALPALELLGKRLKLFDDGGILKYLDLGKLTPEQLQRIADGDDPLAVLLNTTEDPGKSPA